MIDFVHCEVPGRWVVSAAAHELKHGRQLLGLLSEELARGSWRPTAIVPVDTNESALRPPLSTALSHFDLASRPVTRTVKARCWTAEQALDAFSNFLFESLETEAQAVVIIEDQSVSKEHAIADPRQGRKDYVGDTVYRVVSTEDLNRRELIYQICRQSNNAFLWAAVMSAISPSELGPGRGEWTIATLERVARRATLIGLQAFDGDGVLVFERA